MSVIISIVYGLYMTENAPKIDLDNAIFNAVSSLPVE